MISFLNQCYFSPTYDTCQKAGASFFFFWYIYVKILYPHWRGYKKVKGNNKVRKRRSVFPLVVNIPAKTPVSYQIPCVWIPALFSTLVMQTLGSNCDIPSICVPATSLGNFELSAPGFRLTPDCCGHLSSEPADEKFTLFLSDLCSQPALHPAVSVCWLLALLKGYFPEIKISWNLNH